MSESSASVIFFFHLSHKRWTKGNLLNAFSGKRIVQYDRQFRETQTKRNKLKRWSFYPICVNFLREFYFRKTNFFIKLRLNKKNDQDSLCIFMSK